MTTLTVDNRSTVRLLGVRWRVGPLTARRIAQFKANRRGHVSLWIFAGLLIIAMFRGSGRQ